MSTEGSGATSPSQHPHPNEDAYLVHDGLGLYLVCDGASDGPAGEVAAATAIEAIEAFVTSGQSTKGLSFLRSFWVKDTGFEALRVAMAAVLRAASEDPRIDGMATTVTMMLAHGQRAAIGHVGDSRVYLLRNGMLRLLTLDHSLTVAAPKGSAQVYDGVPLECFSIHMQEGDTYLLCTDGAEGVVEDPDVLDPHSDADPRVLARRIIAAARERFPRRDATVVVVRVRDEDDVGWLLHSEPILPFDWGHAVMANET